MKVTESELVKLLNSGAWIVSEFNSGPPPTPTAQRENTLAGIAQILRDNPDVAVIPERGHRRSGNAEINLRREDNA